MRRFDQEWELLVDARTWLRDRGQRLLDSRGPEGMDQGFDVYTGDRLGIRIIADRSQWFVEVRPEAEAVVAVGWEGWFNLEAWDTCLGAPATFHDTRPTLTDEDWATVLANSWWLQPQLDYLRDHLAEIELACHPDRVKGTLACLLEAQRRLSAFPTSSTARANLIHTDKGPDKGPTDMRSGEKPQHLVGLLVSSH